MLLWADCRAFHHVRPRKYPNSRGTSCQATIGVVPTGRACRHFATASSQLVIALRIAPDAHFSGVAAGNEDEVAGGHHERHGPPE